MNNCTKGGKSTYTELLSDHLEGILADIQTCYKTDAYDSSCMDKHEAKSNFYDIRGGNCLQLATAEAIDQ